jgi:hypothetical protein
MLRRRPELTDSPALVALLESWIAANTSADRRMVFETSLGRIHGGGHVAESLHQRRAAVITSFLYRYRAVCVHLLTNLPLANTVSAEPEERLI